MKKYLAEIWIKSSEMSEKDILENIRSGTYSSIGTDGFYERVRICNVRKMPDCPVKEESR